MINQLTSEQSALWSKAGAMKVGKLLGELERNPDATIRAQFKAEKTVVGTRAWAIYQCMRMVNVNFTAEECAAISAALDS